MAKKKQQRTRGQRKEQQATQVTDEVSFFLSQTRQKAADKPLEALTEAQGHYILSIESNDVTFGLGPAGTGKTYVATALACEALLAREVNKIYVVRPMVETEDIGYLPGEVEDKFRPYFRPVYDAMEERLGKGFLEYLIKVGKIEVAPLAFLRGRTLKNAFVILDEAQNTTPAQMEMFMTRMGENVTVVINGDASQVDIKGPNGLEQAYALFYATPSFGSVVFSREDVRRSQLAQRIVEGYAQAA